MNALISPFLASHGIMILDGGLATELEADGYDLRHPLWSGRLLIEDPEAIQRVHRRYLEAGADCVIAATYQATPQGLAALGYDLDQAAILLRAAVELALEARDEFVKTHQLNRPRPLVAASVGPYGAYLADGSEFRGDYDLDAAALREFHLPRWRILAQTRAELMACETVPHLGEVQVLASLFSEEGGPPGWISVNCRDGEHLADGTPIEQLVPILEAVPQVMALGINCTAPQWVGSLVRRVRAAGLEKPVVVYPNSGETFCGHTRTWAGDRAPDGFVAYAADWYAAGARLIGGCCRTGPDHIRALGQSLRQAHPSGEVGGK